MSIDTSYPTAFVTAGQAKVIVVAVTADVETTGASNLPNTVTVIAVLVALVQPLVILLLPT
ncbi:hypothetical protein D3C87_2188440 [compost metagenome]